MKVRKDAPTVIPGSKVDRYLYCASLFRSCSSSGVWVAPESSNRVGYNAIGLTAEIKKTI